MQALTKYVGGHSDLLLGTVSVRDEAAMRQVGKIYRLLGLAVSPDDCSLALRGLQTLGIRLKHLEQSTLTIANWLKQRPEIKLVLHPALPDCPGHDIWKRDFTGSASVFSIVFNDTWPPERIVKFVEALQLFKIGYSWGGVTSLVMAYAVPRPRQPQLRPPLGPPQHRPGRTRRPHRRHRTSTRPCHGVAGLARVRINVASETGLDVDQLSEHDNFDSRRLRSTRRLHSKPSAPYRKNTNRENVDVRMLDINAGNYGKNLIASS